MGEEEETTQYPNANPQSLYSVHNQNTYNHDCMITQGEESQEGAWQWHGGCGWRKLTR